MDKRYESPRKQAEESVPHESVNRGIVGWSKGKWESEY
jgi:hypothetical protein